MFFNKDGRDISCCNLELTLAAGVIIPVRVFVSSCGAGVTLAAEVSNANCFRSNFDKFNSSLCLCTLGAEWNFD